MLAGLNVIDAMVRIRTPREAVFSVPLAEAVITTFLDAVTLLVVIVNVAVVLPLGTRTNDGTTALESELRKATVRPETGAALLMVTVPIDPFPPSTTDGSKATLDGLAA